MISITCLIGVQVFRHLHTPGRRIRMLRVQGDWEVGWDERWDGMGWDGMG